MAQNKTFVNPETIETWMASTGYLFPRTLLELSRFEILYSEVEFDLGKDRIDPEVILGRKPRPNSNVINIQTQVLPLRMAARKGDTNIPEDVLKKIKANQEKRKKNDS